MTIEEEGTLTELERDYLIWRFQEEQSLSSEDQKMNYRIEDELFNHIRRLPCPEVLREKGVI